MRKCSACKTERPASDFADDGATCTPCRQERASRERTARRAVLALLGGKCACCEETEYVFLDIDHVNDDGAEERRRTGSPTWRLALMEPARFQVLCRNCNWAKFQGGCPHQGTP